MHEPVERFESELQEKLGLASHKQLQKLLIKLHDEA